MKKKIKKNLIIEVRKGDDTMIELLNPATRRAYEIVIILFSSDSWVTLDEIAEKFSVSKRTISNDLTFIKHKWGKDLKIQSSKKYGIKLENANKYYFYEIGRDIFTNSLEYSLIINIFLYPNKSILFHTNKLFISESTLNRLFIKINAFLIKENILIVKKNNCYQLISNSESHTRHVIASLLQELRNPHQNNYYLDIKYEEIYNYFDESNYIDYNNHVFTLYYSFLFIVSVIRESQNYCLDKSILYTEEMVNPTFLKTMQKKVKTLNNYNMIHKMNSLAFVKSEANKIIEKGRDGEHLYKFTILSKVLKTYNIEYEDKDIHDLVVEIDNSYSLYKEFIFKPSLLFMRINWFYKEFKENSKYLNDLIIDELKATTKFDGKNLEYLVPIIVFWLCLMYPEITLNILEKRIMIKTDLGIKHNKYLLDKLKEYFNGKQNVKFVIDNDDEENIDLIITNINSYTNSNVNIYFINDFLNFTDLQKINLQLLSNKKLK